MTQKAEKKKDTLTLGIILTAIGVLFLLNTVGINLLMHLWRFWPLILIWMGLVKLKRCRALKEGIDHDEA